MNLLSTQDDIDIVGEAANSEQAVTLALEHRPDVALLDIRIRRRLGTAVRHGRAAGAGDELSRAAASVVADGDLRGLAVVGDSEPLPHPGRETTGTPVRGRPQARHLQHLVDPPTRQTRSPVQARHQPHRRRHTAAVLL
ncbi:hypothetical protein J7F01_19850 [Streptomyces sp. ISL-22]|uniref:hypothetical protein n=1 Tax=unclassified Streptomyces TaxID=2593676 RepID=UPI001BE6201B|nr:hypothetical protein [Streptomyces sp. ISL-24]MBT2434387.1 hypothetical protein [Streptomyces sp. ISL-22]